MSRCMNVVVIDDNEAVLSSVVNYFEGNKAIKIVDTFSNGKLGLNYLLNYPDRYDLIVLDILLPQIDGITVLEELKKANISKKVIVLSSFKDDYSIRKVQTLNANYYMLKPIDLNVLEDRMLDIIYNKDELKLAAAGSVEIRVSSLLHDLGIPSHVRGYKYIREGVLLLYSSSNLVTLVTKDIYPEIANKYETTTSRVERAIRHAIEISWVRGDIHLMEEIFGNSIDFERSKPTNAEFLTAIADRMKIRNRDLVA